MTMTSQQLKILEHARAILKPKPKLTGVEYANSTFKLSPESSSEAGQITLHPYQEEILNCMTDQHTEFVTVKKSARVGYSIMLNITVAYFIEFDPCSILFAQPSDDEAYGYSTDSIEPMIRDNEGVSNAIQTKPISGKIKKEKTVKKLYPGGILEIVGAHSPKNFRRRTVRIAVGDEINGWVIGAGNEGDQIKLMTKRTNDFYNRKVILGSSTTLVGKSRITSEHELGDMRVRKLPCPHCGEFHELKFENLRYELDDHGDVIADTVGFSCSACGTLYNQSYHRGMDNAGIWEATKPYKGHASFHIWAAYSYSAKSSWYHIAKEYEEAKKDPIKMQPFFNTVLGEDYEDITDTLTPDHMMKKREDYDGEVPEGVRVIIMSVDTQNDRLEWEAIGFGAGFEQWKITRGIIYGDPAQNEPWNELEDIYDNHEYDHPKGKMKAYAMGIDSGGSRTINVYSFCQPRLHRRIYALKGSNTLDAQEVTRRVHKDVNHKYYGVTFFIIGVNRIKDLMWSGLQMDSPGRWYIHFPRTDEYRRDYFNQLTSEYKDDKGRWVVKIKGARNEAFDTTGYGYATLKITGLDVDRLTKMDRYVLGTQPKKAVQPKGMTELSSGI